MAKGFQLRVNTKLVKKKQRKQSFFGTKHCRFCGKTDQTKLLDFKNVAFLKGFLTERFKILPSRISGNCYFHQRKLSTQIKLARSMALLPFCAVHHV